MTAGTSTEVMPPPSEQDTSAEPPPQPVPSVDRVLGRMFEGADAMWISKDTVMIYVGFRTNKQAAAQITDTLSEDNLMKELKNDPTKTNEVLDSFQGGMTWESALTPTSVR